MNSSLKIPQSLTRIDLMSAKPQSKSTYEDLYLI